MVAPVMIKEQMEVLGSDGVHVGIVDHLEGRDQVKLTKDDPDAGGEHHFIPLAWVDHVDEHVHLKQSGAEAKARWKTRLRHSPTWHACPRSSRGRLRHPVLRP